MIKFFADIKAAFSLFHNDYAEETRLIAFGAFVVGALFTALMAWIWSFFL